MRKKQRKRNLKQAKEASLDTSFASSEPKKKHVPLSTIDQVMQHMTPEEYKKFRRQDHISVIQGSKFYRREKLRKYCPCCLYMPTNTKARKRKEIRKQANEGIEFANQAR